MKFIPQQYQLGILLLALMVSCADPIELGQEIIEEDIVQVAITDSFAVRLATISTEPVRTYSSPNDDLIILSRGPFGAMQDPLFGQATSNLILQFRLPKDNFGFPITPFFADTAVLDSIILILPYADGDGYGPVGEEAFGMEVKRLDENLNPEQDYFTDTRLATLPMPLYNDQFIPNLDSAQRINFLNGIADTLSFRHLRIPLDNTFGEEVLNADSLTYTSDSLFQLFFKGLELNPTQLTSGMLDFDLSAGTGGIFVHYRRDDTLATTYQFTYSTPSVRTARYEHDFVGSPSEAFIDTSLDSLAFLQGLAGPMIRISIPELATLDNVIVNKAELILNIASLPGDDPDTYPPVDQLIVSERNEEGTLIVVDDIQFASLAPNLNDPLAFDQSLILSELLPRNTFGGQIEAGLDGTPDFYRINLTSHMQGFIDRGGTGEFFLSLNPKNQTPERVVFYGPGDSEFAPKLLLAITRIE